MHADEYAPGVVIDAADLARQIEASDSDLVVLDVRSADRYAAGHVPGAKWVGGLADFRRLFDASGRAQDAEFVLHSLFGDSQPRRVVLYGDAVDPGVARAWWQLRYLGVEGAMVLNGGWRAWEAIDGATEDTLKLIAYQGLGLGSGFEGETQPAILVEGSALRERLADGEKPTLIDARSEREHRAGAVPGSKHLEWSELIDTATGKLLPADGLRAKFASIGVDPAKPAICYCRSGGRASVTVLALAALGSTEAANYYGSWNEWQASGAAGRAQGTPR